MLKPIGYVNVEPFVMRVTAAGADLTIIKKAFELRKKFVEGRECDYLLDIPTLKEKCLYSLAFDLKTPFLRRENKFFVNIYDIFSSLIPNEGFDITNRWNLRDTYEWPDLERALEQVKGMCSHSVTGLDWAASLLLQWAKIYDLRLTKGYKFTYAQNWVRQRLANLSHVSAVASHLKNFLKNIPKISSDIVPLDREENLLDLEVWNRVDKAIGKFIQRDITSITTYLKGREKEQWKFMTALVPSKVEVIGTNEEKIGGSINISTKKDTGLGNFFRPLLTRENFLDYMLNNLSNNSGGVYNTGTADIAVNLIGEIQPGTISDVFEDSEPYICGGKLKFQNRVRFPVDRLVPLDMDHVGEILYDKCKDELTYNSSVEFPNHTFFIPWEDGLFPEKMTIKEFKFKVLVLKGSTFGELKGDISCAALFPTLIENIYKPTGVGSIPIEPNIIYQANLQGNFISKLIFDNSQNLTAEEKRVNLGVVSLQVCLDVIRQLGGQEVSTAILAMTIVTALHIPSKYTEVVAALEKIRA